MIVIHKQMLGTEDKIYALPAGAKILFIAAQAGTPMMWYSFDPEVIEEPSRRNGMNVGLIEHGWLEDMIKSYKKADV